MLDTKKRWYMYVRVKPHWPGKSYVCFCLAYNYYEHLLWQLVYKLSNRTMLFNRQEMLITKKHVDTFYGTFSDQLYGVHTLV